MLVVWAGDGITRIDRFDARSSLDSISAGIGDRGGDFEDVDVEHSDAVDGRPSATAIQGKRVSTSDDDVNADEIEFERYRDLIEAELRDRTEHSVIQLVDDDWGQLFTPEPVRPPRRRSSPTAEDPKARANDTPLKTIMRELEADQDLAESVADLRGPAQRHELNVVGREYGVMDLFEQYRALVASSVSDLSDDEKKIDMKLGKLPGRRSKQNIGANKGKLRRSEVSNSASGSSSGDDARDMQVHDAGFVIEFAESSEVGPTQAVEPPPAISPRASSAGLRANTLSATTRKIAEDERVWRDDRATAAVPRSQDTVGDGDSNAFDRALGSEPKRGGFQQADSGGRLAGASTSAVNQQQQETKLSASERLKMKAKLALNKQSESRVPRNEIFDTITVVTDEAMMLRAAKKRKSPGVINSRNKDSTGVEDEVDMFGRAKRRQ
ncbi:hypothetical protein HDU82_003206 [Entophlyctis luteolus]|nr:hypothetical protein HDU82_003206 [Entophlyctis luteolus]